MPVGSVNPVNSIPQQHMKAAEIPKDQRSMNALRENDHRPLSKLATSLVKTRGLKDPLPHSEQKPGVNLYA